MYPNDVTYVITLSALFLGAFAAIEFSKRRFNLSTEYTRRFAHVVSGFLVLLNHALLSPLAFVFMVLGAGCAILATSILKIGTAVHDVERRTYGEFVITFGYLGAYALSFINESVFLPAILVLTFADPLAGLMGNLLKSPRKTLAGSAVFFVVSVIVIVLTCPFVPLASTIGVAAIVTGVERISFRGFDNLTVPITTAALLLAF